MKSHRGLSAIVGAVFLIAIVVGALSYITYSLETMANFSEQLVGGESRQKNIQDEQFEITSIDVTSGKLNAVIKNTGQIPLKITTLYIDEQGVNDVVNKTIIEKTIAPGTSFDFLTESIDIDIDPTKGYNLKMITSRGGSQIFSINSASVEPLFLNLVAIPKTVSTTFAATLLFTVVNNMSNNNILYNLTPQIEVSSDTGLALAEYISGPKPASFPVLAPGDIASFEYSYNVAGDEGDFVDFGISLVNGYETSPGHLQSTNETITIEIVQIAVKSGESITSLGVIPFNSQNVDLLLFHDETYGTPLTINSYQMDASDATGDGSTLNSYDDAPIIFFSANTTQVTTVTALTTWNASLQYYSDFTDPSATPPDFAFFFECIPSVSPLVVCDDPAVEEQVAEATGNLYSIEGKKGGLKVDGDAYPTWRDPSIVTDGPDGDGYWSFTDNDGFMKDDWKMEDETGAGYSDLGSPPDTEAVWVRIPTSGIDDYMPLIYYGDADEGMNPMDNYAITIGTAEGATADKGKISFTYSTDTGPPHSVTTTCTSSNSYDNGNWQHIVAVRESNGDCNLYINGTLVAGPVSGSTGTNTIDLKKVGIGTIDQAKTRAGNDLLADVASWLHWNNKALTQAEAKNLFYTNYGNNGTRIWVSMNITDGNGGDSCTACEVLIDDKEYILPFHDPSANSPRTTDTEFYFRDYLESNADSWNKYTQYNITKFLSGSDRTLAVENRLSISIRMDDTEQNLPINIRIGDGNYPTNDYTDTVSFLQTGETDPEWPAFLSFNWDDPVELTIFNQGPEGVWFTFPGTRMVLTTLDKSISYGAMPEEIQIEGESWEPIEPDRDGPYIADQVSAKVKFYPLTNPPFVPPLTGGQPEDVQGGDYDAFVFLSGFDEAGGAFLKTVDLGTVHIIGP